MTRLAVSSEPVPSADVGSRAQSIGLERLQPLVRRLISTESLDRSDHDSAEALTRQLVSTQYENFSVVSTLLPKRLRQDFCNVYAFCRTADDLGDELGDQRLSLEQLAILRRQTVAAFDGRSQTPLFQALSRTVERHRLPVEPFLDLISAFEQDQTVTRYADDEQLLDYCRRSANPVGRLVLLMCDYRDAGRASLSDDISTALQLINFWQDVRRDLLDRDRIYLPKSAMQRFGVTEAGLRHQIEVGRGDESFRRLIEHQLDAADRQMDRGRALLPLLGRSVRGQVSLFAAGGMAISRAIRRQNFDTLSRRPSLSRWQKSRLVATALSAAAGVALTDAMSSIMGPRSSRAGAGRLPTAPSVGELE
ncbi:squalene synthase HpnC [Humisphaera borealis]|uniref:Squalene synthase HpnC n=1 Tax=Humisphaera borealis TaxID=2807512 RepID=A0A7M2X0R1_9BACT|nr:squalene synthase HpnC [Humisphaera borealis]QOV90701.1 squalene synthase HpnC [Humisphaera borealis]